LFNKHDNNLVRYALSTTSKFYNAGRLNDEQTAALDQLYDEATALAQLWTDVDAKMIESEERQALKEEEQRRRAEQQAAYRARKLKQKQRQDECKARMAREKQMVSAYKAQQAKREKDRLARLELARRGERELTYGDEIVLKKLWY
jgi:hypothetical protein